MGKSRTHDIDWIWGMAAALASGGVVNAHAADLAPEVSTQHEVSGGARGMAEFPLDPAAKLRLSAALGYGYQIWGPLQLVGEFNYLQSGDIQEMATVAGVAFNLGSDWLNAFFVSARAGIYSGTYTPTALAYALSAGKRFSLVGPVTWKPEVSVANFAGSAATGDQPSVSLVPLQFSVFF